MNLTVGMPASIEFGRFRIVPHRRELRTISGRGCRFTGEISTVAVSPYTQAVAGTAVPVSAPPGPPTNLAEPVSELIVRDTEFEEIVDLTAAHRPVTLTRAGGSFGSRLNADRRCGCANSQLNAAGYIMVEGFEGVRLTAYRDIAGVWTIGYGPHRRGSEGRDHHRGPSLPGTLAPSGGQIKHRHAI